MSNTPHTYTRQCLGKWHAGFQIGNQSFVLSCFDGTEEEAEWYAKMMDKAFAAARAKDAERIEQLEALCRAVGNGLDEMMRPANMECDGAYCTGCWKDINGQLVKLLFAAGFKPTE